MHLKRKTIKVLKLSDSPNHNQLKVKSPQFNTYTKKNILLQTSLDILRTQFTAAHSGLYTPTTKFQKLHMEISKFSNLIQSNIFKTILFLLENTI